MSSIRLVANLIPRTYWGEQALGWGHLQLVFVDDDGSQTELEVQAPLSTAQFPYWVFEELDDHTTAENTANYDIEGAYTWTQLDLGERDPAAVWSILLQVHERFMESQNSGLHFPYWVTFNSNSYATALMSVIGGDIADFIGVTTPLLVGSFPGAGVNPLDYAAFSPDFTLTGSNTPDTIVTGAGHDVIFGPGGNDALYGFSGDDRLFGGGGYDYLSGGSGEDIIETGAYDDSVELGVWDGLAMADDGDRDTVVVGQGWDYVWNAGANDILAVRYEIVNIDFLLLGGISSGTLLLAINPEEGKTVYEAENGVYIHDFENGDFGIYFNDDGTSINILGNFMLYSPPDDNGAYSDVTLPGGGFPGPGSSGTGTIPQAMDFFDLEGEGELTLDAGGEWTLRGATPDGVEGLRLTHSAGTTLHLFDPSQWTLIRGALGTNDLIDIGDWSPSTGSIMTVVAGLNAAGVETVAWSGGGWNTFARVNGAGEIVVSSIDAGNTSAWIAKEAHYSASGIVMSRHFERTDGVSLDHTFAGGALASAMQTDPLDAANWTSIDTAYDAGGIIASRHIVYDNGTELTQAYAGGVLASAMQTDPLNAANWTSIDTAYDAGGEATMRTVEYDDGHLGITGHAGSQTLAGGAFHDVLTGGADADVFVFGPGGGRDRITDFTDGEDLLDLSAFGVLSLGELLSVATLTDTTAGLVIAFSGGERLTLAAHDIARLDDGDFQTLA